MKIHTNTLMNWKAYEHTYNLVGKGKRIQIY